MYIYTDICVCGHMTFYKVHLRVLIKSLKIHQKLISPFYRYRSRNLK